MIVYGILRKYMSRRPATFWATIVYALIFAVIFISISQVGADLRYANV